MVEEGVSADYSLGKVCFKDPLTLSIDSWVTLGNPSLSRAQAQHNLISAAKTTSNRLVFCHSDFPGGGFATCR